MESPALWSIFCLIMYSFSAPKLSKAQLRITFPVKIGGGAFFEVENTTDDVVVTGNAIDGYFIQLGIGTPPQQLELLLDTGSSNFAIATVPQPYVDKIFDTLSSLTYNELGDIVDVPYAQGEFRGTLFTDWVTVDDLNVSATVASITTSSNFFVPGSKWQGILGLAYASLARPSSNVKPFFDSVIQQTNISNSFSMALCGLTFTDNNLESIGGSLIFGEPDPDLFTGLMYYAKIQEETYFKVLITDIKVNGNSLNLPCSQYNNDKSIVDSGSTNIHLPPTVFGVLVNQINTYLWMKGYRQLDSSFWLASESVCSDPFSQSDDVLTVFPNVTLQLAHSEDEVMELVLSPAQYLQPIVRQNPHLPTTQICYMSGFVTSEGNVGTVIGAIAMEGYYVVFDRANATIGFAQSRCRLNTSAPVSTAIGYKQIQGGSSQCIYVIPMTVAQYTNIVVSVVLIAATVMLLVLTIINIRLCRQRTGYYSFE